MQIISKLCVAAGVLLMFSVIGLDFEEHGSSFVALIMLAVGYMVAALGLAMPRAMNRELPSDDLEGLLWTR